MQARTVKGQDPSEQVDSHALHRDIDIAHGFRSIGDSTKPIASSARAPCSSSTRNMTSRRITDYFPSRRPAYARQRCYFLEAPPHIRQTIYGYAGLIPNQCIELNSGEYWPVGESTWLTGVREEEWWDRFKYHENYEQRELPDHAALEKRASLTTRKELPSPFHLLLVCRTVRQEVTKILYGSNYFCISREPPRGLSMLERLSDLALQSLRVLVVRLNDCFPDENWPYCYCTRWAFRGRHPEHLPSPLGNVSRFDRGVLSQWKRICSLLQTHVAARQLKLYVICDCADIETAREVTRSMEILPTLADCAIRIALDRKPELIDLAEKTVWQLLRPTKPATSSSYLIHLPDELLLEILKSTQLVGPSRYVRWSAEMVMHRQHRQTICDIPLCNEMFPPYPECWLSLPELVPSRNKCPPIDFRIKTIYASSYCEAHHYEGADERKWKYRKMKFCPNNYSAFAIHCPCDQSSLSPFLVSRRFRRLAIETFYGANTFLLMPYPQRCRYGEDYREGAREGEPLSCFLQAIPQHAISFLRHIIIVFPTIKPGMFETEDENWLKWRTAISTLYGAAAVDKLSLEIYFTDIHPSFYPHRNDVFSDADREWYAADYQVEMFLTYLRVSKALHCLATRKLRCLGFHVCWPPLDRFKHERRELERFLEEAVMGIEYDAAASGKTMTERFWWEDWRDLSARRFNDSYFHHS